jgi:hypothetical protein
MKTYGNLPSRPSIFNTCNGFMGWKRILLLLILYTEITLLYPVLQTGKIRKKISISQSP